MKVQKILDIETGTGILPRNMYCHGASWIGTDVAENQIAQAKIIAARNCMDIEFYTCPAEKIDYLENTEKTENAFSVNDRYFIAVENSDSGEVSVQTVFSYHQKENVVWAEYTGVQLIKGVLFGIMDEMHNLHFDYEYVNLSGELKKSHCDSRSELIADRKIRFIETWKLDSGESGNSMIQEI